jgi:hypothetical protein
MICSFIRCLGEQTISYCEDKGPNITAGILWAIFILDMLGRGANGPNRTSRNARNIHPTVSKRSRALPWKTAPASHAPAVRLIRQQRASPPCGSRIPHSSFLPPSLPPRPLLRSSPALHASLAPFPPTHSHPRKVYIPFVAYRRPSLHAPFNLPLPLLSSAVPLDPDRRPYEFSGTCFLLGYPSFIDSLFGCFLVRNFAEHL